MFLVAHDLQVFRAVVEFVAVDMVNALRPIKRTTKRQLHHKPMLLEPAAPEPNAPVSARIDAPDGLSCNPARAAPSHIISGYWLPTINTKFLRPLYECMVTRTAAGAPGANNRYPAIRAQLGRLWTCHCLTSYTGRGMRRAGSAPTLPGFSLPQLYQNLCSLTDSGKALDIVTFSNAWQLVRTAERQGIMWATFADAELETA